MEDQKDILAVIKLIQNFGIATTAENLWAILPFKIAEQDFKNQLKLLQKSGKVIRERELLFPEKYMGNPKSRQIARELFYQNIKYLKLCARLPWLRFISLTGTNAYEYCQGNDDIDLFVICAPNRLWILYIMIVVLTKIVKKRPLFCFNYLVDENNLSSPQKTYHNAVQLFMMKPLLNPVYKKNLFMANGWIREYLPNAPEDFTLEKFYRLRADFIGNKSFFKPLDWINAYIFRKYKKRLSAKFPASINRGLLLSEGIAKLHISDKSTMYDDYMKS